MSLETTTRENQGVTIVALKGRLCMGDDTRNLRTMVKGLVEGGKKAILLELDNLSYIDSAGLGALMATYSSTRGGGGSLKLLRPSKKVIEALMVTKMYPVFEIFQDEAGAVKSFTSDE